MQTPIPDQLIDKCQTSDEFVETVFHTSIRCKLCGFVPDYWGCIPKMIEHLKTKHDIKPLNEKIFWIGMPSGGDIEKALGLFYT